MAARLAFANHPVPTDNVTSVLEEMAQQDPTLFQGPGGADALEKLREAARLIKDKHPDRARLTENLILAIFNFLIEKLEPPPMAPDVLQARVQDVMARHRAEDAERAAADAAPPLFPPRHGGRRRKTRRGRKTRRKTLRQRK
jgi:hypothetical protein